MESRDAGTRWSPSLHYPFGFPGARTSTSQEETSEEELDIMHITSDENGELVPTAAEQICRAEGSPDEACHFYKVPVGN